VCYQTRDLIEAVSADGATLANLRVDGGMARNNYVLQKLADLLDCEVHRPEIAETTALGAAYVAGLQTGAFESLEAITSRWQLDQVFTPSKPPSWRKARYAGWLNAIKRTTQNID
jgi:glycerol kinase